MTASFLKTFFVVSALCLSSVPALAQDPTPVGTWEADDRESRYEVWYCGESGEDLCGRLIWIRPDVVNERNSQYLNKMVMNQARRTKPYEWRGNMELYGYTLAGKVSLSDADKLHVSGCVFLILCERMSLTRISNQVKTAEQ